MTEEVWVACLIPSSRPPSIAAEADMERWLSSWIGLLALSVLAGCDSGESQISAVSVTSPSMDIQLRVATDDQGRLTYTVVYRDQEVIEPSPMGLVSTTHDLSRGVTMFSTTGRAIDESYVMLTGKRRQRQISGSEITVPIRGAMGARAELILRAHQDGVAFRYHLLGEGESEVETESTAFAIPSGARVLTRPYDGGDAIYVPTAGEYQQDPVILSLGDSVEASGMAFPTLFELGEDTLYLMVSEADLNRTYCGTRFHETPNGNVYEIRFPDDREGRGIGDVLPKSPLPIMTPWRVISIGSLATIVESTLIDDLSASSTLEDTSWIQPGRAAWSWIAQGTGTPELQSEYIDFASEYGWEYVLIDATWDQWDDAEDEVQALVSQADAAGVKLLLWYNSGGPHTPSPMETPINRMSPPEVRRAELEKIAGWGIAGIKVDFFNSDKQDRINQYIGVLEDAAAENLLVNFHGATIPRGWQRTYPHLMSHEAVNGSEIYPLAGLQDEPTAITNVRHALLRNAVGSMDYTPGAFELALSTAELPYAHSLALTVVFESGLQHFSGRADSSAKVGYRALFDAFPFVGDFMSTVPVVWDETRFVRGDIDDHVILARRAGDVWYLGGIHALEAPVEYGFQLDFLQDGTSYQMSLIEQGDDAASFEETILTVGAGDPLAVALPPNGGFVATLTPQ